MKIAVPPVTYIDPIDLQSQQLIRAKEQYNISVYIPTSDAFYNAVPTGMFPVVQYDKLGGIGFFFKGSSHIAITVPVTDFDKLTDACKEILPRVVGALIKKDVELIDGQLIVEGKYRVGALDFGIAGRRTIFGPVLYVDMRNEHIETFNVCGVKCTNRALTTWNRRLTPEGVGEEIAKEFEKVFNYEM
jgi:lipoate-protein ligase B